MNKELAFKQKISFSVEDGDILKQQANVIKALETFNLNYSIKRNTNPFTHVKEWEVEVYK